jgi:hypothetical protein
MISKHLLISIFLVTSLFAGSKTKRDKGKSDSEPTSGDANDIVDKSKWKNREEKLGEEGEQKDVADKPGKQEAAADTAGEKNDAANTGGQEDAANTGEHEAAADTAEEFTEGGNETPKVNRLIENADESGGEAEHLEVKSEGEDQKSGEEKPRGAEEEEEAEDDQVSDHSEEVRSDKDEGEEGDPKEESASETELHNAGEEVAEELNDEEEGEGEPKEEPANEAELPKDGETVEEEPKGEPADDAELHKDGEAVVEEPKVENVGSDADEIFSSGAEAVENVFIGEEVDASVSSAVENPSSPAEPIEDAPQTPHEDKDPRYHYSSAENGFKGFKNRDQIEVDLKKNGEWRKATISNLENAKKGTLVIRWDNSKKVDSINVKTQSIIRKRI